MRFITTILVSLITLSVAYAVSISAAYPAPNTNKNNQSEVSGMSLEQLPILCGDVRGIDSMLLSRFNSRVILRATSDRKTTSDRGNDLLIYASTDDPGFITIVESDGEDGCILAHGHIKSHSQPKSQKNI